MDEGQLVRVRKGLYTVENYLADEYALLQARSGKALFSYGTALFLWGLSDRVPHTIDVTVPHGTNVTKIKRDNPQVRFHYVNSILFELGKAETTSPQGATVLLYDKERCICDLIRDKKEMDMQLYTQAIKEYFRTGANSRKLLKYGKQFGIENLYGGTFIKKIPAGCKEFYSLSPCGDFLCCRRPRKQLLTAGLFFLFI